MNVGVIALGLMAVGGVVRIIFLNSEIKTVSEAASKFFTISQSASSIPEGGEVPAEVEEAQTEYEWLKNTTDLKKEARLIWIAGTITLIFFISLVFIL